VARDGAIRLLASSGLFSGLDERALTSIVAEAHELRFIKGQALFHEGDPADAFMVITKGSVKVFVTSGAGDRRRPPA